MTVEKDILFLTEKLFRIEERINRSNQRITEYENAIQDMEIANQVLSQGTSRRSRGGRP